MTEALEKFVFRFRIAILLLLALITGVMGLHATRLHMDAGFTKQLPKGHEYIETFFEYQDQLFGANRIMVALRAREGEIWTPDGMRKLSEATDAVSFLPGIDRRTVTSLWTPNTFYIEIVEDGMRKEDLIGGDVTTKNITMDNVEETRLRVIRGGYVGQLVSRDHTTAMITADILDVDPVTQERLNYLDLSAQIENEVRGVLVDDEFDVHILGFVKQMGDIADGAKSVAGFFLLAFVLTALSVYWYSRSWILTFLPLFCSLTSVVWQFGVISLLGFGLDPLAILVPFLVFAIGVSHGVQQINLISNRVCAGATGAEAARMSFRGLLIPGSMALITDLIGFGTLILIPIPMIQELSITATIGVAFKIITNLLMLPLLASFFKFDSRFVDRVNRTQVRRTRAMVFLGRIAEPRNAIATVAVFTVVFGVAVWQSQGRHVGDLHPGTPELATDSRYNEDAKLVVSKFDIGLDVLTVIIETPPESCIDYEVMSYLDRFAWHMQNVPGVLSVVSSPVIAKRIASAWNEGSLKMKAMPRNRFGLVQATNQIPPSTGILNGDCTLMPAMVFTTDHKAETIKAVIGAVEEFRDENPLEGVNIRLASGNIGVQGATNEVLEKSELPMMIYVYIAIISLVIITYRDWRATICCCLPLTVATFLGYWFMKELEIGLKVATMPVMVLAVGIGVDYAFYIYNRLQIHLAEKGMDITTAYQQTLLETGNAVIFTAITLAVGVSTWALSPLKFQADMGLLLTFMFVINMVMAVTALPSLAVLLDMIFPRKGEAKAPAIRH